MIVRRFRKSAGQRLFGRLKVHESVEVMRIKYDWQRDQIIPAFGSCLIRFDHDSPNGLCDIEWWLVKLKLKEVDWVSAVMGTLNFLAMVRQRAS